MPGSEMIDLGEFNKFTNGLRVAKQLTALELYSNLFDSEGRIKKDLLEREIQNLIYDLVEFVKYCMYKKSWIQCEKVLLKVLKEVYAKYYRGKKPYGVVSNNYRQVRKMRKSLTRHNYKSKSRFDYFMSAVHFLNGGDKIYRKRQRENPAYLDDERFNKILDKLGKENEKITDAFFNLIEEEAYDSEDSDDSGEEVDDDADSNVEDHDTSDDESDDEPQDRWEETSPYKKRRV